MKIDALLTELLNARGPGGQEDEVRAICLRELGSYCDDTHTDAAGNVVGVIRAGLACIAIPTENTHGFEMVLLDGISACAENLAEFLLGCQDEQHATNDHN